MFQLFRKSPAKPSTRHETGVFGENAATEYLKREKRFRIICRNWKHGRDEIDIVAWDGEVLVFVEVRTRKAEALVSGYHSVTRHKKQVLKRVFKQYMRQLSAAPNHFRFDIVEVRFSNKSDFTINHFENIPLF